MFHLHPIRHPPTLGLNWPLKTRMNMPLTGGHASRRRSGRKARKEPKARRARGGGKGKDGKGGKGKKGEGKGGKAGKAAAKAKAKAAALWDAWRRESGK